MMPQAAPWDTYRRRTVMLSCIAMPFALLFNIVINSHPCLKSALPGTIYMYCGSSPLADNRFLSADNSVGIVLSSARRVVLCGSKTVVIGSILWMYCLQSAIASIWLLPSSRTRFRLASF